MAKTDELGGHAKGIEFGASVLGSWLPTGDCWPFCVSANASGSILCYGDAKTSHGEQSSANRKVMCFALTSVMNQETSSVVELKHWAAAIKSATLVSMNPKRKGDVASRGGVRVFILALAVSLALSAIYPDRVVGSCGDYLMPLHSFRHGEHRKEQQPLYVGDSRMKLNDFTLFGFEPAFNAELFVLPQDGDQPCDGPNCGQGSEREAAEAVAVAPERLSDYLSRTSDCSYPSDLPTQGESTRVEPDVIVKAQGDGLFRPPRNVHWHRDTI